MKAFDLEKALAGSPVMLKNGCKGFIKFQIPSHYNFSPSSALGGYWVNNKNVAITENWRIDGTYFDDSNLNIIGMYEESNNLEGN